MMTFTLQFRLYQILLIDGLYIFFFYLFKVNFLEFFYRLSCSIYSLAIATYAEKGQLKKSFYSDYMNKDREWMKIGQGGVLEGVGMRSTLF